MVELTVHPVVRALLRPVAVRLINRLGRNNLTEENLERLTEQARQQCMQGEILFNGDRSCFQALIQGAIREAEKIEDSEEREQVVHFLQVGCLREFVLDEARRIKQEGADFLEEVMPKVRINNSAA